MTSIALAILASFAAGLPAMFLARRLATAVGLVDRPDDRKRHLGEVPLAGGLGIVIAAVAIGAGALLFGVPIDGFAPAAFAVCLVAAAVGAVDDQRTIAARRRLLLQLGLGLVAAVAFGLQVRELGDVLGTGPISFGAPWAVLFTALCIVGVINAANMLDGMDGLLSGVAAVSLGTILWLVAGSGPDAVPLLCVAALGALLAFLPLNLGAFGARYRIFLGDSGSMFLGVLLALTLVDRSQGPEAVMPAVSAGWILGLPLLDTVVVIARRLRARRSPFDAGRDHLHHRLLNLGLTRRRTLATMLALHASMVAVGVWSVGSALPAYVFLYGFVALTLVAFAASFELDRRALPEAPGAVPVTPGDSRRGRTRGAAGAMSSGEPPPDDAAGGGAAKRSDSRTSKPATAK